MSFSRRKPHLTMLSSITIFLVFLSCTAEASNICQPVKWSKAMRRDVVTSVYTSSTRSSNATATATMSSSTAIYTPGLFQNTSLITKQEIAAGKVNCRSSAATTDLVNYYTCTLLAKTYGITVEMFFLLNPSVHADCSNIQPSSLYCTAGYIQPLLAVGGLCGLPYNNATCVGTSMQQCCNAQTWTCGNSTTDCAPGTCWEGTCAGDSVYSTDGTCGGGHGMRLCAGIWGDCCNQSGKCGTGPAYCAATTCQSGNCTRKATVPSWPFYPGQLGNSTDGTCGSAKKFSCGTLYGECCNKNNVCGSTVADCGTGCQPLWGTCKVASSISSSSSSTKSTQSSSKPLSSTTTPSSSKSGTTSTSSSKSSSAVVPISTTTSKSSSVVITTSSKAGTTSTSKTSSPVTTTSSVPKTTSTSSKTSSSAPVITAITALPACGQTCFSNVMAQYSTLGCASAIPSCLCKNVNFGYGIRDCANGACGTLVASTVISYQDRYCSSALSTTTPINTVTKTATAIAGLPSCGQTCFSNVIAQYSTLGCSTPDPFCMCKNVNFGYGIRDCANGACGTAVGASVIAYQTAYCVSASSTAQATATGIAALPACGQTCFSNVIAQYSTLGCASPVPSCLCKNVNFGYGIRDCASAACGATGASTVIAFQTSYCASATKTA